MITLAPGPLYTLIFLTPLPSTPAPTIPPSPEAPTQVSSCQLETDAWLNILKYFNPTKVIHVKTSKSPWNLQSKSEEAKEVRLLLWMWWIWQWCVQLNVLRLSIPLPALTGCAFLPAYSQCRSVRNTLDRFSKSSAHLVPYSCAKSRIWKKGWRQKKVPHVTWQISEVFVRLAPLTVLSPSDLNAPVWWVASFHFEVRGVDTVPVLWSPRNPTQMLPHSPSSPVILSKYLKMEGY